MSILRRNPDLAVAAPTTVVLTVISLIAGGGTDLAANTSIQIALLVIGAAAVTAALVLGSPGRAWGALALVLFAVLAVLTYLSIVWSVDPGTSWLEGNRALSYLAAFAAAGVLARLLPGRWRAMVIAVAAVATAVSVYALLVKVYPASFDPRDPLGRLSAPLGYWNAVGLMAVMGMPACLGAAAAEDSARWLRIACPPAIAVLIAVLLMSFSRGALVVAVIGGLIWFALVPLRLRAAALLAVGGAGGGAIAGWALTNHNLSSDHVPLAARTSAGHEFGVVLLVALLLSAAVAGVVAIAMERVVLEPGRRRQIGTALLAVMALVPVLGIVALATSSRGLTGEVSHIWSSLTSPNGGVGDQPNRLLTLSNNRTRYWGDGLTVGEHHLLLGSGAGGFNVAHRRYTTYQFSVTHAHNYLIQSFADLGLVGVVVSLALLGAWAAAAGRALGVQRDRGGRLGLRAPPVGAHAREISGLMTLAVIVVMFGLHNLIDWTWFMPGTAVTALACAGWLAGRGPLAEPVGMAPRRRQLTRAPWIGVAIAGLIALLIATVWATIQPLRSSDATSTAIRALVRGEAGAALTAARQAVAEDPLALDPREVLASIYGDLGQPSQARAQLLHAVTIQPDNPAAWQALGSYDLARNEPRLALPELNRALALDPADSATQALIAQARSGGAG